MGKENSLYPITRLTLGPFQIWRGTGIGVVICLILGCGLIGAFYGLGKDHWTNTEHIWEGVFSLVASIITSIMGVGLLRVSKLQEKWRKKIGNALDSNETPIGLTTSSRIKLWGEKYAMFLLPFITVLREGLEAVVFVRGVSFTLPATSIPLPAVIGLIAGSVVGYLIYRCVFKCFFRALILRPPPPIQNLLNVPNPTSLEVEMLHPSRPFSLFRHASFTWWAQACFPRPLAILRCIR